MTSLQPPSQHEVIGYLLELRDLLDRATRDLAEADEAHVLAKQAHEVARARALIDLGSQGTVSERDAIATLRCEGERFAMLLAEQQMRAVRERLRTLRDQLDAVRSLNSAVKAEWQTQAMGQSV